MRITVTYDKKVDVLRVTSDQAGKTSAGLLRGPDAAVDLATADGYDVVGLEVIGASALFSPGQGYDAKTDTLIIGETSDDPHLTTENGDFVGYWEAASPGEVRDPIGVALRHASRHLAELIGQSSIFLR